MNPSDSENDSSTGFGTRSPSRKQAVAFPALVAVLAFAAVVATLDTAGVFPSLPGPGITSDEPFDTAFGKRYVVAFRRLGLRLFTPENIEEVFGHSSEDHPPLGRWLLGWAGRLLDVAPNDASRLLIAPYRLAPAMAFAVLVFLIGYATGRVHGRTAGVVSAVALVLMPRMFAHAHLAALDTFVALTYTMAVLAVWGAFRHPQPWKVALAGAAWGAALLVKMQGFLVAVPVGLWVIGEGARGTRFFPKRRLMGRPASNVKPETSNSLSMVPTLGLLTLWAAVGIAVFFAGWPWLWIDPLEHLREYLSRSTQRASIDVWYFGRAIADRELPWHYPWVLFAGTVPVGLHALGLLGVVSLIREDRWGSRETLLAGSALFPLVLFSVPGVVVYDGVRLFLMVFPFWAMAVGVGGGKLLDWLGQRCSKRLATLTLGGFLACQSLGIFWFHPFGLSYYNLLVGGLWGAERLGLEVTYWGETVDRRLLESLGPDAVTCAYFAPNLYRGHAVSVQNDFLAVHPEAVRLEEDYSTDCQYLVVYNRKPYLREPHLPADLVEIIESREPIFEHRRQGIWLSRVYRLE